MATARNIQTHLQTGCALDKNGTTSLWSTRSTTSSAPSGTAEASTFGCTGVAWAHFDCVAATAAVQITVWRYTSAVGTWTIQTSFGVNGVLSVPVGAFNYNIATLGADFVHVQVTDVTGGGNITVDVTLSQEVTSQ